VIASLLRLEIFLGSEDEQFVAKIPHFPKNPDRVRWGCDKFCRPNLSPADTGQFGLNTEGGLGGASSKERGGGVVEC